MNQKTNLVPVSSTRCVEGAFVNARTASMREMESAKLNWANLLRKTFFVEAERIRIADVCVKTISFISRICELASKVRKFSSVSSS